MQYQGKSTTGCDDQFEPYHEWTVVPEPEPAPVPVLEIAAFVAVMGAAFVAFVAVMNAAIWVLSMIGGA